MMISTYFAEGAQDGPRAEIHQNSNGYHIEYYDSRGLMTSKENHDNKSIQAVAKIAEEWSKGLKYLNG